MQTHPKFRKPKFNFEPLKRQIEENPLAALAVGAAAATAAAKLIDSLSAAQGRRAYAKQVNNSIKRSNGYRR